jgi:hypothetical protein
VGQESWAEGASVGATAMEQDDCLAVGEERLDDEWVGIGRQFGGFAWVGGRCHGYDENPLLSTLKLMSRISLPLCLRRVGYQFTTILVRCTGQIKKQTEN